jgi:phospholipid/cholesterol/gamma-HCH transport system permease protein
VAHVVRDEKAPAHEAVLAAIGRPFVAQGRVAFELWSTFVLTLRYLVRGRRTKGQLAEQLFIIGNKSVLFITATLGFLGMITIFQVAIQVKSILPDFSMIGAAFIKTMVREFAPTITGLMVATRTGSAIAAEIGSMVVTEQVDALRMSNADPINYLVVPRFVASVVMMFMLTCYAVAVATITGMLMGHFGFDIPIATFLNLSLVEWDDLIVGTAKALAYGAAIPIIAGHAGLNATGGSEGVGWATTRSVVNCSFAVVVLDFVLSGLGYMFFSG